MPGKRSYSTIQREREREDETMINIFVFRIGKHLFLLVTYHLKFNHTNDTNTWPSNTRHYNDKWLKAQRQRDGDGRESTLRGVAWMAKQTFQITLIKPEKSGISSKISFERFIWCSAWIKTTDSQASDWWIRIFAASLITAFRERRPQS